MILIVGGRRDRRPIAAKRLCRPLWLGGLNVRFDEGSPRPIGLGLLVHHAELLPPVSWSAITGWLRRPPDPSNADDLG
jgi:hypothetical protein